MGMPFTPYTGARGHQKKEAFCSLGLVADLKKERLLRWLEERRDDTHIASTNCIVEEAVALLRDEIRQSVAAGREDLDLWALVREKKSYRNLLRFLDTVRTTYSVYERIQIADAETGRIFFSTNDADLGDNVSNLSFFSGALDSSVQYMDDIKLSQRDRKPVLHISHLIMGRDDEGIAVLVMIINVDDIVKPMLHTGEGLGKRGEALLINKEVRILTSLKHSLPDGTRPMPLKYQIKARPAVLAAGGKEGIIEAEDYRGEPVLAAYRYIPVTQDWGWGMVVKRDRAEVFAPLRKEMVYSFSIGLAGIIIVSTLIIIISKSLTRPILSLSLAAKKIAEGDLDTRVQATTRDEVGHLATAFNVMAQRIQDRSAELAAANKELEAFSYSVSHDLRAPLRGMDGFSQALLEDYTDKLDAQGKDYLRRVRAASQRLGSLIDELLNLSRLSRHEMSRISVDLSALARTIAAGFKQREPDRQVDFVIKEGLVANGDPHLLQVVLQNLFSNAWKFTGKHPRARIEFGAIGQGGKTTYFVRDDGAGFDMAYAAKLFGAFQRLHATTEFSGSGIGLATVQRIIHRHGGRVWAEGGVEKGATFYFTV